MGATVFSKKINGAATHAIVIGVGHYPHLPGGKGKPKFKNHGGIGQLKSPPESARAIARWLIENYNHPQKPLASLSLLLSDKKSQDFEFSTRNGTKKVTVPNANMREVDKAVTSWRNRGNKNQRHMLLFFFCGHGISAGTDLSLLLADFGEKPTAPLNGAVAFRLLRQNMDECKAREQVYFVDACRVGSDLLIKNAGFAGMPIIQRTGEYNTTGENRRAPTFYSTLSGAPAFARTGKASLFTEALIEALQGAGCDEEQPGSWQVQTNLLHNAMNQLIMDASDRLSVPISQINPTDDLTLIKLNAVAQPQVPVKVTCKPADAIELATLTCRNTDLNKRRGPNKKKEPWKLSVPIGEYDFGAAFRTAKYKAHSEHRIVRPAFPTIELDVAK